MEWNRRMRLLTALNRLFSTIYGILNQTEITMLLMLLTSGSNHSFVFYSMIYKYKCTHLLTNTQKRAYSIGAFLFLFGTRCLALIWWGDFFFFFLGNKFGDFLNQKEILNITFLFILYIYYILKHPVCCLVFGDNNLAPVFLSQCKILWSNL